MNIHIFNGCLVLSWLLMTAGGVFLNVGAGLLISGLVLIMLAIYLSRSFGVYTARKTEPGKHGEA